MPTEKIGLYIGKFQPFHNGHLSAVKNILPQVDKLIIVIGSSQYGGTADQPFSAVQRQQMIAGALNDDGLEDKTAIVAVPDIHDNSRWASHLKDHVTRFDIAFTNNELVARLLSEAGHKVQGLPVLPGVSGTLVRQKLSSKDPAWRQLVPDATYKVLQSAPDINAEPYQA